MERERGRLLFLLFPPNAACVENAVKKLPSPSPTAYYRQFQLKCWSVDERKKNWNGKRENIGSEWPRFQAINDAHRNEKCCENFNNEMKFKTVLVETSKFQHKEHEPSRYRLMLLGLKANESLELISSRYEIYRILFSLILSLKVSLNIFISINFRAGKFFRQKVELAPYFFNFQAQWINKIVYCFVITMTFMSFYVMIARKKRFER